MRRALTRFGRRGAALSAAAALALLLAGNAGAAAPSVVVLPTTGVVDSVMAGYLHDGIAQAAQQGAAAVVIEIDTPGGSLEATNDIVGSLLDAQLPVITWVAPSGGRAASAGTFITLAGNIALMAPGTSIGAASPVDSSGGDIGGTLGEKVRNDAAAKIQSIAEARGRNVEWARSTVLEAASASATQAVALGAADGIAATLDQVLAFSDGKTVEVGPTKQPVTLELSGATTSEAAMGPLQSFLHLLADPNIAFVLFVIGGLGLATELVHPNLLTGIVGSICLVLAFIGFGSLPLNVAGLILIGLGLLLFVLEVNIPSHGLLTLGGLICLALGGAAHQASDVDEGDSRGHYSGRFGDGRERIEARIRDRHVADIGFHRRESVIGRLRARRLRQRVEHARLAGVRQADDAALKSHYRVGLSSWAWVLQPAASASPPPCS